MLNTQYFKDFRSVAEGRKLMRTAQDKLLSESTFQEQGQAMILVLEVIVLLSLMLFGLFSTTQQMLPLTSYNSNYKAAIIAAQAGEYDYLANLNAYTNYWQYSATNEPVPPSPPNPPYNPAFVGWTQVSGIKTNPVECFRYTPDMSKAYSTGIVYLSVEGRAGYGAAGACSNQNDPSAVIRTITAGFARNGYMDYIYFTNYETTDPALYPTGGSNLTPHEAINWCQYHQYDINPYWSRAAGTTEYGPDPNYCANIYFVSGDNLGGPVHSNDSFYVCGSPQFTAPASLIDPNPVNSSGGHPPGAAPPWHNRWQGLSGYGCDSNPNFDGETTSSGVANPAYHGFVPMPADDSIIASLASANGLDSRGNHTLGCLYQGPTVITINPPVSTGAQSTLTVDSPGTNPSDGNCVGNNLPLPSNGVIDVKTIPSGQDQCVAENSLTSRRSCYGDVILNGGVLAGQLNIVAEHNIYITGNITYCSGGVEPWCSPSDTNPTSDPSNYDVLGLIANNFIDINNPSAPVSSNPWWGTNQTVSTIDAAILALNHSFMLLNYDQGTPLGTLTLNGAIAQQFRGPVGTFGPDGSIATGYQKNYTYDWRLQYLTPPYYLAPTTSAWTTVSFGEQK
ncbi:MAG: hypothetical protein M1483_08600 [Actinobacteria bacterium]|nr:hypothetical protein [Actinomycetota bacterium]MCL6105661.1 hypothetical protein [Actinomycetota bacterium]